MSTARLLRCAVAALLLAGGAVDAAQPAPSAQAEATLPSRPWNDLSAQQREVLAPVHDIWDELAPDVQEHLAKATQRWPKQTEAQREQIGKRMQKWADMPRAQRIRLLERYRQFHQLPPEQQTRMLNAFKRFDALPETERAQLRERFERMSPAERNAFLAGAGVAGHIGTVHEILQTAPASERRATREMFDDFTLEQRQAFAKAWRTLPEEQRDGYRRQMLMMSPEQRSHALQAKP